MANGFGNYRNNTGVKITRGNLEQVQDNLRLLANLEVLVGFPETTTNRDDAVPEGEQPITNAAIGYIQDNGAPEAHIPARPFMKPGLESAQEKVEKYLVAALKAGMRGNSVQMEQAMIACGMAAKLGIQNKITEGIPPPLAEATLKKRMRRGSKSSIAKAAALELNRRDRGEDPTLTIAHTLIETGQMRNAVNFVIRAKSKRRK